MTDFNLSALNFSYDPSMAAQSVRGLTDSQVIEMYCEHYGALIYTNSLEIMIGSALIFGLLYLKERENWLDWLAVIAAWAVFCIAVVSYCVLRAQS